MSSSSIVHDADASDSHATSSQASDDSAIDEMRLFPHWIGCQRASTATVSSTSSFQCHSPPTYPVTEWGAVEDFEQEVSVSFLPSPDVAFELNTPLRTQASSATLQPSGTVTPTPNNIARKRPERTRPSSFLNFNIGNIFRLPANSINNNNNTTATNNITLNPNHFNSPAARPGLNASTHLPPPPFPQSSQDQSHSQNDNNNNDLVSLPSVSSASVSTFASASAFTVASNPSISTYASASASMAPSSASKSQGGRKSLGARSHISSSSWSYSYPYSDYMSSTSGLSIPDDSYLEDAVAGSDDDRTEEPTSPTTTTASTATTATTSVSVLSSSSKHSNLVRRLRLRGGADEIFLKPRSATGISSSAIGVISPSSPSPSPSPVSLSKIPFKSKFLADKISRVVSTDDEELTSSRQNPMASSRLKKRLVFVELDEEGRMIDSRRGGKVSSSHVNDDTLKPKGRPHAAHAHAQANNNHHDHNHHDHHDQDHNHFNRTGNGNSTGNDTISKSTTGTNTNPLALAAEHLLSNNPFLHMRFRKQKRLLVKDIPTDDGEYTRSRIVALRQWAESLGAVRRLLRSVPDGTIWIEFKDREVAENVCHLHAYVHIPNVGRVRLDWVEGREAG